MDSRGGRRGAGLLWSSAQVPVFLEGLADASGAPLLGHPTQSNNKQKLMHHHFASFRKCKTKKTKKTKRLLSGTVTQLGVGAKGAFGMGRRK